MAAIISASVRVEVCRSMVAGLYSPSSRYECLFGRALTGNGTAARIVRESEVNLVTPMSPKALLQQRRRRDRSDHRGSGSRMMNAAKHVIRTNHWREAPKNCHRRHAAQSNRLAPHRARNSAPILLSVWGTQPPGHALLRRLRYLATRVSTEYRPAPRIRTMSEANRKVYGSAR